MTIAAGIVAAGPMGHSTTDYIIVAVIVGIALVLALIRRLR